VPAESAQGGGRHDHPPTERTGDTPAFWRLTPESEQAHSFVDLTPCRCCGASNESGFDAAAAGREESTEAVKTLLGRMEMLKDSGAIRVELVHGLSRLPSSTGSGPGPSGKIGGTALVSSPLAGVDAPD
jgi:hypothetical protein